MPAKKSLFSKKFIVTALLSMFFAWINTALVMGGIRYLPHVVKNPYYSGQMIGTATKWLAYSFVIAIVINFFANFFRKEKKRFSYMLVGLLLALFIGGTLFNIMQKLGIEQPAARFNFIQGCIANAKASKEYQSLDKSNQQKAIYKITEYCAGIADGYFKTYDQCMSKQHDELVCNKQALFAQCMAIKNNQKFCQSFTASYSIK